MLLVKNARLYSTEAKPRDILVCGRQIIEIDDKIDCGLRALDAVLDAEGMVAIPGYFDQHVHITGGGGEGGFSAQVPPIKLSQLIRAGVTTLVGLLGTDGTTRSVENLVAKTKALNEEGWSAFCLTGSYEFPSPTITGSVRRDIVFISEIIGVKIAVSDHRSSGITRKELIRLAFDARAGGILSGKAGVVHLHVGGGKDEIRTVIDIVKTTDLPVHTFKPTHLGGHIGQAVEFAQLGGYVDFTAGRNAQRTAEILAEVMKRAPWELITLSSDGNGSLPTWNDKKEIVGIQAGDIGVDHMVVRALIEKQGLTIADAIKVLTENPARSLGMYPYKGCLAEGSCADILLLDGRLDIDTVIANGRVFLEHGKQKYTPKFESV
ncbi:MAG: Isoaspartyl dipeptidase [Betaproteobacteria bacterium ADurb.Bin341]|nr:MAG: Isoaspartyl dipeptidase [Betaproteobacteria bacterium ADurb.Bin341]HOG01669.1 beta-aspartyl-peptidase [Clostridia bacterium]